MLYFLERLLTQRYPGQPPPPHRSYQLCKDLISPTSGLQMSALFCNRTSQNRSFLRRQGMGMIQTAACASGRYYLIKK